VCDGVEAGRGGVWSVSVREGMVGSSTVRVTHKREEKEKREKICTWIVLDIWEVSKKVSRLDMKDPEIPRR